MDAIILRQIDEALGYDNHMNAMVFDMEKKRVAQNNTGYATRRLRYE